MNEEFNKILEHYGADLDDSGEPDEAPEFEGVVTLPTPDEEKQALKDWRKRVASWNVRGHDVK